MLQVRFGKAGWADGMRLLLVHISGQPVYGCYEICILRHEIRAS